MSDNISRIQNLEKQNGESKLELAKLNERKKGYEEDEEKIDKKLQDLELTKDELEKTAIDLQERINEELEKSEAILR